MEASSSTSMYEAGFSGDAGEHPSSSSSAGFFSYAGVNNFVIVGFASVGVVVNLGSLFILTRRPSCTVFHNLLKVRDESAYHSLISRE